ncbi:response regulator [Telmatospirillum sp. J64-1]|uniref:response regulator n=1 Tax=Telmatospirillum sp. J64-1 TaxID=2502183 RepID=UPI00163D4AC9|nr:response regulator [Telmatospirillum sp. J64-1]
MQTEFRFEYVRVGLADPNTQVRQALRAMLQSAGFRDIGDYPNVERLEQAIAADRLDLLIVDAQLPGGDVWNLIYRLRHHRLGKNPFMLVMALSAEPDAGLVRRVVDSGADDMVLKPVSVGTLIQRIAALARKRKPFVITHNYIGPDRRRAPRPRGSVAPMMEVPNPLRSRAVGSNDRDLQRVIDAAAARINEHKMERYSVEIGFLVERIQAAYETGTGEDPQRDEDLDRLHYVAEDLGRRMQGTAFAYVSELALSLKVLVERVKARPSASHRADLELLPKLAASIRRAFEPDRPRIDTAPLPLKRSPAQEAEAAEA